MSRPARGPRRMPALLSGVLLLALAACGTSAPADTPAGAAPAGGAFPVTLKTQFGDVTVPSEPKRVVALGWGDAETAVALGVQPVGAADWLPVGGDGLGGWMKQRYTTPPKILGTLEVSVEQIAALAPDLILDTRASGKKERYDQLSQLGVPVVSIPPGALSYLTTWEAQLDLVGKALGRATEADKLKSDLDAKFATAAKNNPAFKDATVVVGSRTTNSYGAYINGVTRVDFMRKLGFVNSPAVQALAGTGFSITISSERLDLLDAGLTIMTPIGVDARQITEDPLFQAVPSVRAGHSVLLSDKAVSQAFASATAPGLSYALDVTVPMFAAAMAR